MKKRVFLCALMLLASVAVPAQRSESIESFWQKFKTAVIAGDKRAVAALTTFPLGMSYGIPSVRNRAALMRRYRQVFSEQTDAAKCFATAKPETEAGKPAAARSSSTTSRAGGPGGDSPTSTTSTSS